MSERKTQVKERERKRGGERKRGCAKKNERVRTRENEIARERENSISRWINMLINNVEDVGRKRESVFVCV